MDDSNIIFAGNDNFVSIGDFERSLSWGAEIEFEWKGVLYGVIRYGTDHKITIYQCGHPETEKSVRNGGRSTGIHGRRGPSARCDHAGARCGAHDLIRQAICSILCGGRQRPPHFSGVSPVPHAYSVLNAQRRGSGT